MAQRTITSFLAYQGNGAGLGVPLIARGAPGAVYLAAPNGTITGMQVQPRRLDNDAAVVVASNVHGAVDGFRVDATEDVPGIWWVSGSLKSYRPFLEGQRGRDGLPGVGVVPTDEAIKNALDTPGTLTGDWVEAKFSALSDAYVSIGSMVVSVMDHGALGDGVTDDTAAVTAARDVLAMAGGGTLHFPAGKTYRINGAIDLVSNMKIAATGATLRKIAPVDTYSLFVARSNGVKGYGASVQNVVFEGGTYRGSFESGLASGIAVSLHHAQNVTFRDIEWTEAVISGHIADLAGCDDITFERCVIRGWDVPSGREYNEAIQLDNSTRLGLGIDPLDSSYDGLPTKNVTVKDCHFLPLTIGATTYPAPNPLGNHGRVQDRVMSNIVFERNTVVGGRKTDDLTTSTAGFFHGWLHFFFVDGVYIRNNDFINVGGAACKVLNMRSPSTATLLADVAAVSPSAQAVAIQPPRNVEVTGNRFEGFNSSTAEDLLYIIGYNGSNKGQNVKIDDNTFIDCTPAAFETHATDGQTLVRSSNQKMFSFSGNTIDGAITPLVLADSDRVRMDDNDAVNISHIFAHISRSTGVKINFNDSRGAAGVYMHQCVGAQVHANELEVFAGTTGGEGNNALITVSGCKNISGADNHVTNTDGNTWIERGIYVYGSSAAGSFTNTIGSGTFSTSIVGITGTSPTVTQAGTITGVA